MWHLRAHFPIVGLIKDFINHFSSIFNIFLLQVSSRFNTFNSCLIKMKGKGAKDTLLIEDDIVKLWASPLFIMNVVPVLGFISAALIAIFCPSYTETLLPNLYSIFSCYCWFSLLHILYLFRKVIILRNLLFLFQNKISWFRGNWKLVV